MVTDSPYYNFYIFYIYWCSLCIQVSLGNRETKESYKICNLIQEPGSRVRILMYRTQPIVIELLVLSL